MPEKLCVFCAHMEMKYDEGDSCPTCGYDSSSRISCQKSLWNIGKYSTTIERETFTEDKFRKVILTAEKCPEYLEAT